MARPTLFLRSLRRILLVTFAIIFVAAVAAAMFFGKDAARTFSPLVIESLARSLGRPIGVEETDFGFSLQSGLRVRFHGISIAEDPAFGREPFLRAEEVRIGLDFLAFLKGRGLVLPNVLVRKPWVRLARDRTGRWNVQSLGRGSLRRSSTSSVVAAPALLLKSLRIEDGRILMTPGVFPGRRAFEISGVRMDVRGLSLAGSFPFELEAAVGSSLVDLRIGGRLRLRPGGIQATHLFVTAEPDALTWNWLGRWTGGDDRRFFPEAGRLQVEISEMTLSSRGIERLELKRAAFHDGAFDLGPMGIEGRILDVDVEAGACGLHPPRACSLKAGAAVLRAKKNLSFDGEILLDPRNGEGRLSGRMTTDLGNWPLDRLGVLWSAHLGGWDLDRLEGRLEARFRGLSFGRGGVGIPPLDVDLSEGRLGLHDESSGGRVDVEDIEAGVRGAAPDTPFSFSFAAALFGDRRNVRGSGTASWETRWQRGEVRDASVIFELDGVTADRIRRIVPAVSRGGVPDRIRGELRLNVLQARFVSGRYPCWQMRGVLKDGGLEWSRLPVPVEDIEARFSLTEDNWTIESVKARLADGEIGIRGGIADYRDARELDVQVEVSRVATAPWQAASAEVKLDGLLSGRIRLRGWLDRSETLTGGGEVRLDEARIEGINLLRAALDRMSFLPGAVDRIEASLSPEDRRLLDDGDTPIEEATAKLRVADGRVAVDPLTVRSESFAFQGRGTVSFDGTYSVDGTQTIPARLSAAMQEGVPDLEALLDDQDRIALPVHVGGRAAGRPQVSVTRTVLDLGRRIWRTKGRSELRKVLDKALGIDGEASQAPTPEGTGGETGPAGGASSKSSPGSSSDTPRQIIEGILDSLFK